MANENQNKSPEQIAADKIAAAKLEASKPQMPASDAPVKASAPNITRDAIEQSLVGQYFAAGGKSREECEKLAKQRALEMVP